MLEILCVKSNGQVIVAWKKPCAWSQQERIEFDIRDMDDPTLEATMTKGGATRRSYPYQTSERQGKRMIVTADQCINPAIIGTVERGDLTPWQP